MEAIKVPIILMAFIVSQGKRYAVKFLETANRTKTAVIKKPINIVMPIANNAMVSFESKVVGTVV